MEEVYAQRPRRSPASDVSKNVEKLFETRTILEIREVETKTRAEIEEKQQQLRYLVGNSYRDLISSADTILEMSQCCETVVANTVKTQEGFLQLASSIATVKDSKQQRSKQGIEREELYAIGSRIKYLVDTPEILWGFLDTKDYLEAAQRFLRASEVNTLLVAAASPQINSRFPLMRHQWPLVEKFKGQILERAGSQLQTEAQPPTPAITKLLTAVVLLEGLDSRQVLDKYLRARRVYARECMKVSAASGEPTQALLGLLRELAAAVQGAICQVGELFLAPHMQEDRPPKLTALTGEEEASVSELFFGPLKNAPRTEVEAWQEVRTAASKRLAPLPRADVAASCLKWLQEVADEFLAASAGLMGSCTSAAQLAELESGLRGAISGWRTAAAASPEDGGAAAASGRGVADEDLPSSWEGVCDWVLGKRVGVWEALFETAFLQHAKLLIEGFFRAISDQFAAPLDEVLAEAGGARADPPGEFLMERWPEAGPAVGAVAGDADGYGARKRARVGAVEGASSSSMEDRMGQGAPATADSSDVTGWRGHVELLRGSFDGQLRQALEGCLLLLAEHNAAAVAKQQQGGSGQHRRSRSRGSGSWGTKAPRAAAMEPHIQQCCGAAAGAVAGLLEFRLEGLGLEGGAPASTSVVEQALCVGRISNSLANPTSLLRVILGPPEDWPGVLDGLGPHDGPSRRRSELGAHTGAGAGRSSSEQYQSLQARLRAVALAAHSRWARWAAEALAGRLQRELAADPALSAPLALRSWEDTVVTQEEEPGTSPVEMRFPLPCAASPGVLVLLMAMCRELQRAGGHVVGPAVLEVLEWHVAGACFAALQRLCGTGDALDASLLEKGVLQLLFDLRFLRDVLSGGRAAEPRGAAASHDSARDDAAAANERRRLVQGLEADLQARLDPIDWATYEPYLWANEAQYYQRTGVLFGALLQLNRMHTQVVGRVASSAEANTLSMAVTTVRFSYLPISMPSISGLRRAPGGAMVGGADGSGGAASVVATNYSFSHAAPGGKAGGAALEQEAESAAASAFEALQSRFTSQRLGAFGAMLGDKAAEMTSIASQSFGDMLPGSSFQAALPGLGTGFSTGASNLLSGLRGFKASSDQR